MHKKLPFLVPNRGTAMEPRRKNFSENGVTRDKCDTDETRDTECLNAWRIIRSSKCYITLIHNSTAVDIHSFDWQFLKTPGLKDRRLLKLLLIQQKIFATAILILCQKLRGWCNFGPLVNMTFPPYFCQAALQIGKSPSTTVKLGLRSFLSSFFSSLLSSCC